MKENSIKNISCITELFTETKRIKSYVKVCAPMVRYSKVQFRTLVRNYGVDLCFTPMILADSFCQNERARSSEFSTTVNDSPLIVQFAANNVDDFLDASKLVYPYADGIDLNCGCPQRWAIKDGYGCAMLNKPELIQSMVKSIRNNLPSRFSVSVKIRLLQDLNKTLDICQQLEHCGVTFLTVHGRTPEQKGSGNVDKDALKLICDTIKIPVVANGGIKTLSDAENMYEATNCDGVMVASGILSNPALYSGADRTPLSCVSQWMNLKNIDVDKISFQCYHHHLVFMLEKLLTKQQKIVFNNLSTFEMVDKFLETYVIQDKSCNVLKYNLGEFISCQFADEITQKHCVKCRYCGKSKFYCICISEYDCESLNGAFFTSHVNEQDELDFMESNLFDEMV